MIELQVRRDTYTDNSTIGELSVNGEFFCYTLEPRKDQSKGKPYAIPSGVYPVLLILSPHFGFVTPHLQDTPGFTEIEIHPGDFPKDTIGCTVVGAEKGVDAVWNSRATFEALMRLISDVTLGEPTVASDPDGIRITYIG
jgi:hypothetical protein